MFGTLITQLESHVITSIDHVICGFGKYSNPLVYRYMSVALRSNAPVRPSLRRTASLENFLDKNRGEDQIELRKTTLDNKDGTANKAGGQSSSTSGGGSRKYTHQSRSSSRTAATAPCAPKTSTRASRESIKRSVCTTQYLVS